MAEKEPEKYLSRDSLFSGRLHCLQHQHGYRFSLDAVLLARFITPVPDEKIPLMSGTFNVPIYGMTKWGDLFNSRQKLALITFTEKVRLSYKKMIEEGYNEEYAKAVVSYLALTLDMLAAFTNVLARWENTSEAIKQLYSRQALPMLWDFVEANPFSGSSGSFIAGQEYYLKVLSHLSKFHLFG